jgi:hypothetical protein
MTVFCSKLRPNYLREGTNSCLAQENKKRAKDDEILKSPPSDSREWKIRKSQIKQEIASLKAKVKDLQKNGGEVS